MILVVIYLLAFFHLSVSLDPHEITFLIRSQKNVFHRQYAEQLKLDILEQTNGLKPPQIYLTHETFNAGSWAITQFLAENVQRIFTIETKWLIILEDQSGINMKVLLNNLKNEDFRMEAFYGHPLMDKEATIIHHFAFFDNPTWFLYPFLNAGIAITIPLVNRLLDRLNNEKLTQEFFIDASHEFSMFVWNNGKGHKLTAASYFCPERRNDCAIYNKPYATCSEQEVSIDNIFFAVKTCSKFHKKRIPVIKSTWCKDTTHVRFYSDVSDPKIPTINTNVQNTDVGHCKKSLSIINLILKEIQENESLNKIEWIVLTDDDTLLSIHELQKFLKCYNPSDDIYLGERYGYRLPRHDGFSYITGGGGIVFSLKTLKKLSNRCSCPSDSSPDDMIIGACLKQFSIEPIHSTRFHQARTTDYPSDLLKEIPISFHKFWQINPYEVYRNMLLSSETGKTNMENNVETSSATPTMNDHEHFEL